MGHWEQTGEENRLRARTPHWKRIAFEAVLWIAGLLLWSMLAAEAYWQFW